MKILFLGDFSNVHATLAAELQKRGHNVTLISDGGTYMHTHADIMLYRRQGIASTAAYLLKLGSLLPKMTGYDVVQIINPKFTYLRIERLKLLFNFLKAHNRSIFLTLAGDDYFFIKACMDAKIFRFSEYMIGNQPTELERTLHPGAESTTADLRDYHKYIYENLDGGMSLLPEYDMAARPILGDRLSFTNIPLDVSALPYIPMDITGKIKIFIGLKGGKEIRKGTADLLEISRDIERNMPDKCEVIAVRNISLSEYLERMKGCHIVLDQLYSYSPGVNGLQAMALGKVSGTGAQPEYYQYLGNPTVKPIFTLSPLESQENLKKKIVSLISEPHQMLKTSEEGRKYVEKHNSVGIITSRFESHWNKILSAK